MSEFRPGTVLDERFEIEAEVGRGAVGVVYRAYDRVRNETTALKVMSTGSGRVDPEEEARFVREGRLLASLKHPAIVRVSAFGQLGAATGEFDGRGGGDGSGTAGAPYIAMEWLAGEDLARRVARNAATKSGPLPLEDVLYILAEVADALSAAHAAGIVHRDVKPSNVFLVAESAPAGPDPDAAPMTPRVTEIVVPRVQRPRVKLVDFGVAATDDTRVTRSFAILGTPAYMAPEQARGDDVVDGRADLYGLGATLFELVAGRPPHIGPTPMAILARLVTTPAPRLSEVVPEVPLALDELVARLLASSPEDRPDSAAEVAAELRNLEDHVRATSRPVLRLTAVDGTPQSMGTILLGGEGRGTAGAAGFRLVTSILAVNVPRGEARQRILSQIRARGAEATELGGDALVAHLGVRKALGDEAATALELALRLARLGAAVGVATGRSRIDRMRPTGEVVDRAAALARDAASSAKGTADGTVLADTTTSELGRGRYSFQVRADGAAVVGEALVGGRSFVAGAPFVGREAEMLQLTSAFERSASGKSPVIVTVTGAPGIGKTRIRREFLEVIAAHPRRARLVPARCEPFGKGLALGALAELVRALCRVPKGASTAITEELVSSYAASIGATNFVHYTPVVARWLANELADEGVARDALWLAATALATATAAQSPLVLALEDGQWCDAESLAFLDHLLGRGQKTAILLVVTARPHFFRDDAHRFAFCEHQRIELRPLSARNVRAIAKAMLGTRAEGDEGEARVEAIAAQAAGSPLFAEELARLAAKGQSGAAAPTIEAAIQVNLDSQDDAARDAALKLAVFGPSGWDRGLEALGVGDPAAALRALSEAEIVVEQASSRFPGTREWAFKHPLAREVAYAALSEDALRECHAKAGAFLAEVGDDDAVVARHLELGADHERAAVFLERAARRALAANALHQAAELAERALAFAEDRPTGFARAQLLDDVWNRLDPRSGERETAVRAMAEAVFDGASEILANGARARYEDASGAADMTARLEEVRGAARKAVGGAAADPTTMALIHEDARCAAVLASRLAFAGALDRAAAVADELLALDRAHAMPEAAIDAWQTLAVVHQTSGAPLKALAARRSAAETARTAGLVTREATLTANVGFALTTLGAREEALAAIEEGIRRAQEVGAPGVVRHGQMNLLGWTATFGGEEAHASELLAEPRRMADDAASGGWVPNDRATLGVLFYRGVELLRFGADGRLGAATTLLGQAALSYRATKMHDVLPVALGHWATAVLRGGDAARARTLADEGATLIDQGRPSLLNEASVFLALHDVCVAQNDGDGARAAVARGLVPLARRLRALAETPYLTPFCALAENRALLLAAKRYELPTDDLPCGG